jgi:hypothetical protein
MFAMFSTYGELPRWDTAVLSEAPATSDASVADVEGLQSLFVEGLDYKGKPARFFAYLGFPENVTEKVPAVVLVHGGGGTAFANWVQYWNSKGYAALALDTEGQIPIRDPEDPRHYQTIESLGLPWTGAPRGGWAGFTQYQLSDEEQWLYHAVADSILSVSLLAAHPNVDADRIGIVGISWGSVVCSIAGGVDPRLAFVVPQYIGGNLQLGNIWYDFMTTHPVLWRWNPSNFYTSYSGRAQWLWINRLTDKYGLPPMTTASWRGTGTNSWMTLLPTLGHAHYFEETGPNAVREIYAFADSVTRDTPPLARILQADVTPDAVSVTWQAESPIVQAKLCFTTNRIPQVNITGEIRKHWEKVPYEYQDIDISSIVQVTPEGNLTATIPLPTGTLAGALNLIDERGFVVSSDFFDLSPAPSDISSITFGTKAELLNDAGGSSVLTNGTHVLAGNVRGGSCAGNGVTFEPLTVDGGITGNGVTLGLIGLDALNNGEKAAAISYYTENEGLGKLLHSSYESNYGSGGIQMNLTGLSVGQTYQMQGLFWDDGKTFSVCDVDNTVNTTAYSSGDPKGYSWTATWTADSSGKKIELVPLTRATLAAVSIRVIPNP